MTITYSLVELNPALEATVFRFHPPEGSHEASAADQAASGNGA